MSDASQPVLGDTCAFVKNEFGYTAPPCGEPKDADCHKFDHCVYRAEIESGLKPSLMDINFWCHQHHLFEATNA